MLAATDIKEIDDNTNAVIILLNKCLLNLANTYFVLDKGNKQQTMPCRLNPDHCLDIGS